MQDNNHAQTLAVYEEMRLQFSTMLDLLMPEEDHALRLLRGGDGLDPVSLRDALVSWMNENLDGDGRFIPGRRELFTAGPRVTGVAITHLVDEYWWVELYPVYRDDTGALRFDTTDYPGVAILRVDQSSDNLPEDYHSPRLTPYH